MQFDSPEIERDRRNGAQGRCNDCFGGKNSANTTQLAHFCRSVPVRTYHIETRSEIEPSWFRGVEKVGITAGASTPEWIIEKVKERIQEIEGESSNG